MAFIGHTMAIPGMDIAEGIRLFAGLGLDGIEIVAQEGTPFHIDLPEDEIQRVLSASKAQGLPIVTLTPYFWAINDADDSTRSQNVEGLRRAVRLARRMGARFVRAYGGKENAGGAPEQNFERAVSALRDVGKTAADEGVTLIVENHPGTMTRTGAATRRMIDAVALPSVRALYDPCNVLYDTDEDWLTTLTAQLGTIGYIHCKDYRLDAGKRAACVVGEGVVPWLEIARRLGKPGVPVSFEYEKRWYPDQIEDAKTGLPKCMRYAKEAGL